MSDIQIVLAVCIAVLAGMAVAVAVIQQADARAESRAKASQASREGLGAILRVPVLEADRATLRERLSASESIRRQAVADLHQVAALMHGPAQDDEVARVARDRLDEVIRRLR